MFYDLFCELCEKKGVSPTRAALEIGLSKATPTSWKNKGITPQAAQLQKIASYFGVSVDSLLGIKQKEKPAAKISELDQQLEGIDFALFGEVKDLTDEQKQDVLDYIRFKKAQGQQGKQK